MAISAEKINEIVINNKNQDIKPEKQQTATEPAQI
jgi:hypothetical protein